MSGIQKTRITWENDPVAVTRFTADVSRDLARQGDDEVFAGVESRAVDTEVSSVVSVASSADRSESTTHRGELQTSYVLRSERLGFWSGRQMTRDLLDVDPVPDAVPAYLHGSQVEYYSCTHQRWLRGVMTLDALDHRVEGCDDHLVAVVYQVHLVRTQQLRHNVPLYHLRPPQESGQVVEVFHLQSWHRALVKKRVHGRTEDYHVVDYEGQELTVPGSCIRRCLPANTEVMVYGGPAVGWQRGVVQGVAEGTSWCPTGSAESAFHLVSRATESDVEAVDFGFVPDARVFTVNMSGAIQRVPQHLLFNTGGDEPAAPATQLAQRLHVGVSNFFSSFVSSEP